MEYYKNDPETGEPETERTRSIISGKTFDMQLIDPSIDLALNKAGKAEFTVPAQHPYYSYIVPMKNNIEICYVSNDIETSVFFGRIAQVNRGWNNQKKVICEGALAFFNDTIQRYKKYPSKTTKLEDFVTDVLTRHNEQITDESRKIYLGKINLIDPENPDDPTKNINKKKVYRLTNYETTLDVITEMCVESEGGYIFVHRDNVEDSYVIHMDWISKLDTDVNQPARFGLNLTDLNQDFDPDELYTALLPLGGDYDKYVKVSFTTNDNPSEKGWYVKTDDGKYEQSSETTADADKVYYSKETRMRTIKNADDNPHKGEWDYIQNDDAVAKYGFILKTKRWDDINDKNELYKKAVKWMKTERFDKLVITCDVADLSTIRDEFDPFMLGKVVKIVSPPHGITEDNPILLPISEIHYDLNTGKKEVTIGTQPQVTLSRITKKGKTKEIRIPDYDYEENSE
jgi:hypothetical protein